jgi:fructose-1,6-bisphosphatase I
LKNSLRFTGKIGVLASETERSPMLIEEAYNSNYVAVFDPLDGFSNIEAGISTGTIFGIFKENDYCLVDLDEDMNEAEATCLLQTLRPGSNLVASGYCMYSSATILVLTLGQGVFGFTLDDSIGEFILTHPNIRIPNRGKVYSFNEDHSVQWEPPYQFYLADLKSGQSKAGKPYSSRYIGSMVGDIHRTLLTGGVFGYPANRKFPQGKLRLLYEAAPMAFLMEQAGGKAITGRERILDITPTSIDQCTPIFLGSKDDIEELESYVQNKL